MSKGNLINEKELEAVLKKHDVSKDDFFKAVERGEINPMVYHDGLKKLMPFRVSKFYPDGSFSGFFIHEMN